MRVFMAAAALLGLAGVTHADLAVVPNRLVVVDKVATTGKAKVVLTSRDGAAGITKVFVSGDKNGVSALVAIAYANGATAGRFIVPRGYFDGTEGWQRNDARIARYINKQAPAGSSQAKIVALKEGKALKLASRGLGDEPLDLLGAGDPTGSVFTAFCVTNSKIETCHCSEFTGCRYTITSGGLGARLACKGGVGDPLCTAAPLLDNGLTVLDRRHRLEWEKKDGDDGMPDPLNLHDVDNLYVWAGRCSLDSSFVCQPDPAAAATCTSLSGALFGCAQCPVGQGTCEIDAPGITTVWDWVNQVNAAVFAGHADWRLPTSGGCCGTPTSDAAEIEAIYDLQGGACGGGAGGCTNAVFGPTASWWYHSASVRGPLSGIIWTMSFAETQSPVPEESLTPFAASVRAVRDDP